MLITLLTLTLNLPSARATSLPRRCQITLTTALTKGPVRAVAAWKLFGGSDSAPWTPARPRFNPDRLNRDLRELERGEIPPADVEATLFEIAADTRQSAKIIHQVCVVAEHASLKEPGRLLELLRRHPQLENPKWLLRPALNPDQFLTSEETARLVSDVLAMETRADLFVNDVPYSSRPGWDTARLHWSGRISTAVLVKSFIFMIENPRANDIGFFWTLAALQFWAEGLYSPGVRIPKRAETAPLLAAMRRRLGEAKYELRQEAAMIERIGRLLAAPAPVNSKVQS